MATVNRRTATAKSVAIKTLKVTLPATDYQYSESEHLPAGVYKKGNRYRACAYSNGRTIHLGVFDNVKDAEIAVLKWRLHHPVPSQTLLQARSRKRANTTSKYKGVYRIRNKWKAEIVKQSQRYYLGSFDTELEAAIAYDNAALILYGKYALTNQQLYPRDFRRCLK